MINQIKLGGQIFIEISSNQCELPFIFDRILLEDPSNFSDFLSLRSITMSYI